MQPAHDRPDGNIQDFRDLFVGKTFDIGQQHRHSELLGQCLDGLFDLTVGEPVEQFVLGAAAGGSGLEAAQAPVQVQVFDLVDVRRRPLLGR